MAQKEFEGSSKKRAFTLVEILMVVLIVGVLLGMMLLSATNASDSAKAARIIADIKTMRSAAFLYKADHGNWPIWFYDGTAYRTIPHGSPGPGKYCDLTTKGDGYWVGAMRTSDDRNLAFSVADLSELPYSVKKFIEKQADKAVLYGDIFSGMPYQPDMDNLEKFNAQQHNMLLSIITK